MAEIVGLYDYPFTGGRERNLEEAWVGAGGFVLDRAFVLYDSETDKRYSRKNAQCPALAQVRAVVERDGEVIRLEHAHSKPLRIPYQITATPDVVIEEFGDMVPAIDLGDTGTVVRQ